MSDERDEPAFKVEDRRRFDAEGRPRDEKPSGDAAAAAQSGAGGQGAGGEAEFREANRSQGGGAAEITFSSFVVGLATQALMFMGAVPDPGGNAPKRNMGEAGAIIDIIGMLERKTKGNLAEDEARLLEDVLYDLRMRYVRESRRGAGEGSKG